MSPKKRFPAVSLILGIVVLSALMFLVPGPTRTVHPTQFSQPNNSSQSAVSPNGPVLGPSQNSTSTVAGSCYFGYLGEGQSNSYRPLAPAVVACPIG